MRQPPKAPPLRWPGSPAGVTQRAPHPQASVQASRSDRPALRWPGQNPAVGPPAAVHQAVQQSPAAPPRAVNPRLPPPPPRPLSPPLRTHPAAPASAGRVAQRAPVSRHGTRPVAVIQRVKAYRVDRDSNSPKVIVEGNRVVDFVAEDGFGINISFVNSEHADYYLEKHGGVLSEFEITDAFWEVLKTRRDKKKTGNKAYDKLTVTACTDAKVPNKENALYLEGGWLPHLKKNLQGVAQVHLSDSDKVWAYWWKDDDVTPKEYEDGMEMGLAEAKESGFQIMTIGAAKHKKIWHE